MSRDMNARLISVVGPSGAGKDSLLAWLRDRLPATAPVHWARRSITRPMQAGGEAHESLDLHEFEAVRRAGGFVLHWQANGLHYGIRQEELLPLKYQQWVMLNGSRAHLFACAQAFPGMTVLHLTADAHVLYKRLRQRGRESMDAIEARLQRMVPLEVPTGSRLIEVRNNSALELAGRQLLSALEALPGWPQSMP